MAYDQKFPTDDGYLADFPPGMREQIRAIVEDMVVNALALQGLTPGNASGNIPVSNGTKCTNLNAELHGGNLPSAYAVAGHVHSIATDSSNGLMSNTDKTKLDGIATGAKVNQNAFSNILVGTTTIQADSETDTLEIVAGTNVSIVPDATNDRITINNTYAHPTGDGNIHVPATGTANSGKVLTAGATAGSLSWTTPVDATKAPINHSSTATTYGISSATEYGHVMASSATPLAAGTAAVGTDNGKFAREGHVHPAQTTITGNAGTATKLETARTISLTGDVTGSATFDGSVNASITTIVADNSHTHTLSNITDYVAPTSGNQVAVLSGTIAHGGTIPLPSGYTQAQCMWWVTINGVTANSTYEFSVNASRVVTFRIDGSSSSGNYFIIGVK